MLLPSSADAQGELGGATQPSAYVQHVRDLLEEGLSSETGQLDAARKHYQDAKRICDTDPRLYHACGLVCLKHRLPAPANRQFELARDQDGPAYLPAWQALVRASVSDGKHHSAGILLVRMAERLRNAQDTHAATADRTQDAVWIGRMMGFLEQTVTSPRAVKVSLSRCDEQIRESLTETLRESYDKGRQGFQQEYDDLAQESQQRLDAAQEKQQERVKQKLSEAAESRDRVEDEKEKLRLQGRQLDEQFRARVKEFQTTDSNLQREYAASDAQKQIALRNLEQAQRRRAPLQVAGALQRQLEMIQMKRAQLVEARMRLMKEWQAFLAQNQVTAMQMNQMGMALEGMGEKAERQTRFAKKSATRRPATRRAARGTQNSLSTYFPLDFDAEKKRLLASFSADAGKSALPK